MTDRRLPETNWAPTRASTAVALLATAGGVAALAPAVGVSTGALVGIAGAVCLAAGLWLLMWDRWRVPATLGAALLLVPAGAGVAVGLGYELLVAFAAAFPASNPTRVVGQSLRIVGTMAVLAGCTVAAFGAVASVRSVATRRTVSRCLGLSVRVALLPVGFFLALAGHALVTNFSLGSTGSAMVGDAAAAAVDWLFAPAGSGLHLFSFWLLFAAAAEATRRALGGLPLRELAGEASVGDYQLADGVAGIERGVGGLAVAGALGMPVAVLVGVAVPTEPVRAATPIAVYRALVTLTSSSGLRHLLAWIAVVAGVLAAVAALVRRTSRASTRDVLVGYAPFVAGLAVVAGVGVVHRPVLEGVRGFVAGRLDAPLSGRFQRLSNAVVEFYGPETVVLGLTAGVLVLAASAIVALYLSFVVGLASDRVAGPSLAGGGLFVAAAFAATVGVPTWVVLGGLVAALAIWDAGEFAATLGAEVGRRAKTRRVELLHALASLSVGVVGAATAAGLARAIPTGGTGGSSVALLGAVAAVVLLVMALR